ncbi:YceI family protein [Anatilimnocola sp. NA78]|uniref:YceI family protein n=1 Tax=Anatilimnocola sp. NA78 TaxID=3415683 RepID=UPI003CE5A206
MRIVFAWSAVMGLIWGLASVATAEVVPLDKGVATISNANSKITFVGTHSGDKPDPRTGGFGKFTGQVKVDPATKSLTGITADIDTSSLFTTIPKLTDHLKNADFFEVREYPKAKFESTKVVPGKDGQATVTGKLTLHGVTKEISFPATLTVAPDGISLKSEFAIQRSEFGMTYGAGKVDDKVSMTVVVGEKTVAQ